MALPCCFCSLQNGTITIAILGIVVHMLVVIICIAQILGLGTDAEGADADHLKALRWILLIASLVEFGVSLLLFYGALQENLPKLNAWFVVNIMGLILLVILFVIVLSMDHAKKNLIAASALSVVFQIYFLFVVKIFIRDVRRDNCLQINNRSRSSVDTIYPGSYS